MLEIRTFKIVKIEKNHYIFVLHKHGKMSNTLKLSPAQPQYQYLVDRITNKLNMNHIEVYEANVENAAATLYKKNVEDYDKPIIVYNPEFMNDVHNFSPWAMYFVFAHEVAHHYNNDLYGAFLSNLSGVDRRSHRKELNADYIAGWVLRCEGATYYDASALYDAVVMTESDTHPGECKRRQAMARGWNDANCKITPPKRVEKPVPQQSSGVGEVLVGVGIFALLFAGISAVANRK